MSTAADFRLTNADVESMPDDGNRYELIDGELYVSSAPTVIHQRMLFRIAIAFNDYLRAHPIGEILPGVGVIFDDHNGVIPDLVFATEERMRKATAAGRFHAAPEVVIEILSPGASNERRDRHVKLALYAARGVDEYWIADPLNRSMEIYRRDAAAHLVFSENVQQDQQLTCRVLPGFSVPVNAFFI